MDRFILVHDINDGATALINETDISRIESRFSGSIIYFKQTADDFDKTRHQVNLGVEEDIDYFKTMLGINSQ